MQKGNRIPLLALALVFSLIACGGGGGGSNPAQTVLMGGSVQGVPLSLSKVVSTFAGDGVPGASDCTVGTQAEFNSPKGITTDGAYLYIADSQNQSIRKVAIATGAVTTIAGDILNPVSGYVDLPGPLAQFNNPGGITADGKGNLYVADTGNHLIRKIVIATQEVSTIAGDNVNLSPPSPGYSDGAGPAARFAYPNGLTWDGKDLYVADGDNHLIRRVVIDNSGNVTVSTIAGDNVSASQTPNPFPDGGYADGTGTSAMFSYPTGITTDGAILYVADTDNHLIRKIVIATGEVTTVAGDNVTASQFQNQTPRQSPPGGYADNTGTSAKFSSPTGITTDGTNLYVAESENSTIRNVVIATGVVTTIAGDNSVAGYADGTGTAAWFNRPFGITADGAGLYVADRLNNVVRRIR